MKRFSPRISAAFALTLVLAFTVPAGAASPDSAYGDPVGAIPGQATVADELETPDTFSILSTGSVSVTWGGHGHGIGMPQWGAQAMAFSQGKKHEDILKHFYEGVQFGKTDLEGGTIKQWGNPVRVGLAQGQNWVRFQPKGGPATICFGPRPDSCTNHTAAANETWIVGRTGTACVLKKVVGSGEEEVASFACSNPESGKHGIQFATVTWDPQPGVKIYFPTWASARDLYARGKIEFMTAPSGLVNVRAAMELEEYLYGLGEVPNTWHPEALKAQAVAARSFALYRMWAVRNNADGLRVDCGCHLRNTTADQAYRGYEDSASAGLTEGDPVNGAKWLEAVNSTRGKAMWHTHHGSTRAIEAYYFASTGGATENNPDRWGGTQYPYLKSKNDPGARFETVTYTASTFASKLGFGTGTVERVHIPERYASGRPKKVIVSGKDGSGKALVKEFTSSQFKSALGYGKGDWVKEVTGVQFVDGPIPGALVLHQQSTATWFYIQGGQAETLVYGRPGDIALMGDWDGDGIDTPGLYRQSDGFVYLRNSNSSGNASVSYYFGRSGDIPVVGDFDGDGKDTLAVYRPSTGRFYIKNELKDGWADYEFVFGRPGDVPFAGDWNGDGKDTIGLRRPSNGFVYLKNSNSAGWADYEFFYGKAGDVVFAGDWDGDGKDSIGLYRPSTGMVYIRNPLSSGNANVQFYIGRGIYPVAGAY